MPQAGTRDEVILHEQILERAIITAIRAHLPRNIFISELLLKQPALLINHPSVLAHVVHVYQQAAHSFLTNMLLHCNLRILC